ncbi:MAG: SPOR domain-containing protein [Helicobacteraceae bacterium]
MQKNELNDILLHQKKDKKDKGNVLLVIAAVLIVFFLGIIGYKIISQSSNGKNTLPTQNKIAAKSDDFNVVTPKQEPIDPVDKPKTEEDLLDERISMIKKSFDEDVKKEKDLKSEQAKTAPKVEEKPKPSAKKDAQNAPLATPSTPKRADKPKQKQPQNAQSTQGAPNAQRTPHAANAPKKPAKDPKAQRQKPQIVQHKKDKFYIQVASFVRKPNAEITKLIQDRGYKYVLRSVDVENKKYIRLYVGPYSTKDEAMGAMDTVSKDLGLENAFVKQDY